MRILAAAVAVSLLGAPVAAQGTDPFTATTDPLDRAVMAEVAATVAANPDIVQLDVLLAKLPRPTPLRGLVQGARASVLSQDDDPADAVAAIEESLRLLPGDPWPKMVAAYIFTFSGSPQRAADLWIEVSRTSPQSARGMDNYVLSALIGRLNDIGDTVRSDRVEARMGEIGYAAGLANERSASALARARDALRNQRNDDALGQVSAIVAPDDLATLYVDRRYQSLWPRIAEWAGKDLDQQSRRYLEDLRRDWIAADDLETASAYARHLARFGEYRAIVGLFLPMFDRMTPDDTSPDAQFLVPIVARALANLGREPEARALLEKVRGALGNDSAGQLNIDGAYITLARQRQDWADVIARSKAFVAKAETLGSGVNSSAVRMTQGIYACALSRTGRIAEAEPIAAQVTVASALTPGAAWWMHLCRGDTAAAQALLVARLADEKSRDWALATVQPARAETGNPNDREISLLAQKVRSAPDVVAAANRVGRILPQPVIGALPAGFDPMQLRPDAPPASPDSI